MQNIKCKVQQTAAQNSVCVATFPAIFNATNSTSPCLFIPLLEQLKYHIQYMCSLIVQSQSAQLLLPATTGCLAADGPGASTPVLH